MNGGTFGRSAAAAPVRHETTGGRGNHPAIERFLVEVRERARVKPEITEGHIACIESALVNACEAAEADPVFAPMWRAIKTAIARPDWSVKRKLEEMGTIGAIFGAAFRRHAQPMHSTGIM